MTPAMEVAFDCQSCGACCSYSADWPRFSIEEDEQLDKIPEALVAEIVAQLQEMETTGGVMGFLTHHLVHDEAAWAFCAALLSITAGHPACRWRRVAEFTDR